MTDSDRNEAQINALLQAAGPRRNPAEQARSRIHDAVLEEWRQLPEQPGAAGSVHKARPWWPMAAAAMLILGIVMTSFLMPGAVTPPAGEIAFLQGSYFVGDNEYSEAVTIPYNARVETTGTSSLTMRSTEGVLITLAPETALTIAKADTATLHYGRIYVDTDEHAPGISVVTPHAVVRDIGTQFDVAVSGSGREQLVTAVRTGSIEIVGQNIAHTSTAINGTGEKLSLRNGRISQITPLAATDEFWSWRTSAREPFILAGASVYDYLRWMARDSGHQLSFRHAAVEQTARMEKFIDSDLRSSDTIDIASALATTTLAIRDPEAQEWEIDFK